MTAIYTWLGRERARTLAVALALTGMAFIYMSSAKNITVVVDGEDHRVSTHARTVAGGLHDAGLVVSPSDRLSPASNTSLRDGMVIELTRARLVLIERPAGKSWLTTPEHAPTDILAAAGLRFYPGDRLWVDGEPRGEDAAQVLSSPSRLRLEPARSISVNDGSTSWLLRTAAPTVGEALWESGLAVSEGDRVEPSLISPLAGISSITIIRSAPLTILVDGLTIHTRAVGGTVGDALTDAGLALIGLDFTQPSLQDDGTIRVVRVSERVEVEEKPLPFETAYQPIDDLEIDNQRVVEAGAYGVLANRVRVRLEDGEETQRFVEGDWVARQPEPRVIGYGTQIIPRSINTDDGPIQYCRAVNMYATSYSPSRAGVPAGAKNFGITASGQPLTRGLVAIDRSLIPFGTLMYVPGYGFAEAADTGGGVKGRWIDLGYDDDNYVAWHQYVTVYFLCPLPGLAWIFP
jgi:uncharacterized protein YabE (DUF348 family)